MSQEQERNAGATSGPAQAERLPLPSRRALVQAMAAAAPVVLTSPNLAARAMSSSQCLENLPTTEAVFQLDQSSDEYLREPVEVYKWIAKANNSDKTLGEEFLAYQTPSGDWRLFDQGRVLGSTGKLNGELGYTKDSLHATPYGLVYVNNAGEVVGHSHDPQGGFQITHSCMASVF